MGRLSVHENQKGMIVWNFMEELLENYQNANENKISTV